MTKERLKEIHDSIGFQMQLQKSLGYKSRYDDLLVEEIDLYNEVIDLQEDYNKVVHESTEFESKVYQLQERIDKVINGIETTISIIKQHPSKDEGLDFYIISKLESFVKILKGDKE